LSKKPSNFGKDWKKYRTRYLKTYVRFFAYFEHKSINTLDILGIFRKKVVEKKEHTVYVPYTFYKSLIVFDTIERIFTLYVHFLICIFHKQQWAFEYT
jgi:hypothetical protein